MANDPFSTLSPDPVPRLAISVPEAALALSVSERCVWRLIHDGELPVVRIGRRTLIHVTALEAFLAERSAPQATPSAAGGTP